MLFLLYVRLVPLYRTIPSLFAVFVLVVLIVLIKHLLIPMKSQENLNENGNVPREINPIEPTGTKFEKILRDVWNVIKVAFRVFKFIRKNR